MKEKVLKMLLETDGFVSGQKLCEELNVSRTAVWKCISKLKEEGYEIESVTNKGYHLSESPDLINEKAIKSRLNTKFWGQTTVYYDEIDSTNNAIKRLAEDNGKEGLLAVAEIQTAGKGRRGRNWVSPKGIGVWMSFLLRPQILPSNASMLTLVSAMAVRKAVEKVSGLNTAIKWPNDIVISGKKICGILTEMSAELDWINYVVVGIGINVNTTEFPDEISNVATSIFLECNEKISRSQLIAEFGSAFEEYYDKFLKTQDLSLLIDEYNANLANMDNKVKILEPSGEYEGISKGINEFGELIVIDNEGNEKIVRSGEVSVRGIYGYV